jgi:hypothetical protein
MASLVLVLQVAGCYRWNPDMLSPEQAIQGRDVLVVRWRDPDSKLDTVRAPWVRNGRLGGTVADTPWAVPLGDVRELRTEGDSLVAERVLSQGAYYVVPLAVLMMGALVVVAICRQDGQCERQCEFWLEKQCLYYR